MYRRGLATPVMVAASAMTIAGCTQIVAGTAQRAMHDEAGWARGYGYINDRCGLLHDSTVRDIAGADEIARPYSGAVCQYVLMRQSTALDITFSWFETGSLDRERGLAQSKKAQITELVIERHQALLARRSVTGNACAGTAATNPGVASWWVQVRGDAPIDPCQLAQTLLSKTLAADL
jgi:hypothetical protein